MDDLSFGGDALREQLAGNYVAWSDGEVAIKAESSDELYDRLAQMPVGDQGRVVIEYIPRTDVVHIY
jgi:hypothetical protein